MNLPHWTIWIFFAVLLIVCASLGLMIWDADQRSRRRHR